MAEAETERMRPEHQLFFIIGRLCALRATTDTSHNNDIRVVMLAKYVDSDLEDWKNGLPSAFSYSTILSPNTEAVFSNTYHVYNDTWSAAVWNLYRCARILTQQIITDWLSHNSMPNPVVDRAYRSQAEVLLANLAYDICASAPYILGASHSSVSPSQPPRATTGALLLWPFYLAATMDQETPGMRAWIIRRLELIGQTMGIKQAESLANVLRIKREITAWDTFEAVPADEVINDW